jgi:hypothetical protein
MNVADGDVVIGFIYGLVHIYGNFLIIMQFGWAVMLEKGQ